MVNSILQQRRTGRVRTPYLASWGVVGTQTLVVLLFGLNRQQNASKQDQLANGGKALPVQRAWPMFLERGKVRRRAIAFVLRKAILRVRRVRCQHQPVTMFLGQYARR